MCSLESSSSEATRQALVNAAIDEVALCGWRGATSRRITRRAGVNLALITYHFGSKSTLLDTALRAVVTEGSEMLRRAVGDADADVAVLVELAESEEAGRVARFLLAATREAVDDDDLRRTMADVLGDMRTAVADVLGLAHDDPRVPLVAAAVDGLMMHRLIDPQIDVSVAISALRRLLSPHAGDLLSAAPAAAATSSESP